MAYKREVTGRFFRGTHEYAVLRDKELSQEAYEEFWGKKEYINPVDRVAVKAVLGVGAFVMGLVDPDEWGR